MPLTGHNNALGAAVAAEAANNQGKFWEFHDKLFANQDKIGLNDLKKYAKELGLNMAQFEKDLLDPRFQKRVETNQTEARSLGVAGTPAFFINGRFLNGAKPFSEFANLINAELQRRNLPIPPSATAPVAPGS